MAIIGFHSSHELYSPRTLLEFATAAYQGGFQCFSCSDHFAPWSADGQSGYAWSWLGSAMERVPLPFGTVCAPGQRYHPAIIAQAAATLSELYPDRFWIALGTGQNLNEHITGDPWPNKEMRQRRLLECVNVIRRLWNGETVSHDGLIKVSQAKLYTLPPQPPMIFGAAISDATAEWVGSWADGLLTVAKPYEDLKKCIAAFRQGGGIGKPIYIQAAVSLAASNRVAEIAAYHNWGIASLEVDQLQDIALPEHFDHLVAKHDKEEVSKTLRVSSNIKDHIHWLESDFTAGVDGVYIHYVGHDMLSFIESYSKEVLPAFDQT